MTRGKKYRDARQEIDRDRLYALDEAAQAVSQGPKRAFDETVDLAVRLGVDPRQSDQMLRGAVDLPHGTGSDTRVVAFAEGAAASSAHEAGAVVVGADDLIERIAGGWLDFDSAVATPDMMPRISRSLGRVLGPRGIMPNPRAGTIAADLGPLVTAIRGGRIDYRTDRTAIVHAPVGKVSFSVEQLTDNVRAVVDTLVRSKPAASKGRFLRSVTLSATMGPGIRLDTAQFGGS
jgi:large subunit ribosomal protein L1